MPKENAPSPGKDSGVTADDLVGSADIKKVDPGRINLVQSREVGDQYVDHGAVCEGKGDSAAGCFLTDRQRDRLIGKFELRVQTAATNYKDALTNMRVDELVKKDDDLNWVVSLALDLVGAHLVAVASRALASARSSMLSRLSELEIHAAHTGGIDPNSVSSRALALIERISEKGIEAKTKAGFDAAKTGAKAGLKSAFNAEAKSEKAEALSFIDELKNSCDAGFTGFADHATSWATDAELVVLWDGMHVSNHTPAKYKSALEAKLARFRKSGVSDIGRKQTLDREFKAASVHRDTRVVWVRDFPGDGKKLYYQSQDGDFNPNVIAPGDPGSEALQGFNPSGPQRFGARQPRESPRLDRLVPDEFIEAALVRNEAVYGSVETIDPVRDSLRAQGFDPTLIEHGPTQETSRPSGPASPIYSAPSIFSQQPGRAYPSGSIFNQAPSGSSGAAPLAWNNPSVISTEPHK